MADAFDDLKLESLSSFYGDGNINSVNVDFKVDKSFRINDLDMRNGTLTIDAADIPFSKTAKNGTTSNTLDWWFDTNALLCVSKENIEQTVNCKAVTFSSGVTSANGARFLVNYPNAPIDFISEKFNINSNSGDFNFNNYLHINTENGINIKNINNGFALSNSGYFTVDNGEGTINFAGGIFKYTYRTPNASFEKYLKYSGNSLMISTNDPNADPYFLTNAKLIEDDQTYLISPKIPRNGFNNANLENGETPDLYIQQGLNFGGAGSSSLAGITYNYGLLGSEEDFINGKTLASHGSVNMQLTLPFNKIYKDGNIDEKLVSNWHGSTSIWTSSNNCPKVSGCIGIKYYPGGYGGKESTGDEPIAITTRCDIWPHKNGGGNQIATNGWVTENFSSRVYIDYLYHNGAVNTGGKLSRWAGSYGASIRMMNEGHIINPFCNPKALQYTYTRNIAKGRYLVSFKLLTSFSRGHWGGNWSFCARAAMFIKGSKLSNGETEENEELTADFFESYKDDQYPIFDEMASKYIYSVSSGIRTDYGENNHETVPNDGLIGKDIRVFDETKDYDFVIIPHRICPISSNKTLTYNFPPIFGFLLEMQKISD